MLKSLATSWIFSIGAIGVATLSGGVSGQDYPNKPIRIVTGSAGGGSDFTTRQVAGALSASFGQSVIVDNRAGGSLAPEVAAKAPADGYTFYVGGTSFFLEPLLQKVPFDPIRDFSPVTQIEFSVNIVVVHPSVPVKSLGDLIALAKARPGELNYGSAGVGTSGHLATELFKSMAKVNMLHIPFKGGGALISDLAGGHVQLAFITGPSVAPYVKAGRLRALAVTSPQPSPLAPGLPPVAATVPGYEAVGITGLYAPIKTPGAIIKRVNEETVRFLRTPEAKETFLRSGAETVGSSPEQFAAAIKTEIERLDKIIRDTGLRAR